MKEKQSHLPLWVHWPPKTLSVARYTQWESKKVTEQLRFSVIRVTNTEFADKEGTCRILDNSSDERQYEVPGRIHEQVQRAPLQTRILPVSPFTS